ncbi:MAG: hypothetical protein ABSG45_06495 [Nitrososphaerales archaeon]
MEIWVPYGDVESLLTLQAENLGELLDPAPDSHAEELGQILVERIKGLDRFIVCDRKPSTLKLLKAVAPRLPQDGTLKIYACHPQGLEDGVPELRGRVLKLSPPPASVEGGVTYSPELVGGTCFVLATGEPDPLFGYADARVSLGLSGMEGARKAAYLARGGDEPAFLEETPAHTVMVSYADKLSGATFGTVVTRGGEPFSLIEGGSEDARGHFPLHQVNPAKGIVVGAGGRGYDDTFSQTLRLTLGALKGVRKGGDVLLVGECREGLGSEALQMRTTGRVSENALRKGFYADGMEEIAYLDSLKENYSVTLLSSLPELYASGAFRFRAAKNSVDALQKVFGSTGRGAKVHVFTRAPETLLA